MKNKVMIIAEAGVNHNGDMLMAKKLIDAAAAAGVDYVKFQTFTADKLVSKKAKKANYQRSSMDDDDSQYTMLKNLELSHSDHLELIDYCDQKNIKFFSTAFDIQGITYLNNIGLEMFKIPSGEITNYPYLKAIAMLGKPVIMSTGMCNEYEIKQALDVLIRFGILKENICILHCTTDYPTPMRDVNLKAMLSIRDVFDVEIGYSDHTLGIEVTTAAVALGAKIIEKHFTLDRTLPGPDHIASLEPDELIAMVSAIRNIETAISGDGVKNPSESEIKNIIVARKSIHLNKRLSKGHVLCEEDLIALRPGDGISPMEWNSLLGKELKEEKDMFAKLSYLDLI